MNIVQVVMTYLRPLPVCFAPRCDSVGPEGECVRGAEPSIRILVCPTLNKVDQNKNKPRTGSKSNQAKVFIRQVGIIIVVGAVSTPFSSEGMEAMLARNSFLHAIVLLLPGSQLSRRMQWRQNDGLS